VPPNGSKVKGSEQTGVLRWLIQEYCRQGQVEKMLVAKEEFEASVYEYSAGMLAMLFDVMVRFGKLDEEEARLRKLNSLAPDFILDEHKVLDFATLLGSKNCVKVKNMAPWYALVYVLLTLVS
jgi:leucine-rich PPR motif-containing protein